MSLNLSATTHTLEVTTTGAGTVHVEVSFTDMSAGTGTGGSEVTTISSATTTTVCSAPAASTVRFIDEMTVMAVGANGVTVKKDISATETTLIGSLTLAAGERAQFTSARGWRVFNADGSEKTAASGGSGIAISAGTQSASSGTISFANNGFITFGMTNSSVITAQHGALRIISAGTTNVVNANNLSFANSNGLSFGLNGSTITGDYAGPRAVSASIYGGSISNGTLQFSNDTFYSAFTSIVTTQNVLFSLSGSNLQATALMAFADSLGPFIATQLSFSNANGITWGLASSSIAGLGRAVIATASHSPRIGIVSHVGGNVQSSVTQLAFSNASGVTFSLSTAASAATLLASVNDQSIGVVSHVGGQVASSVTRLAFSNASNVTFSLSTAAGAATLLASVASQSAQTFIGAIAGGTQTATSGTIVFSDSNGISFGLSGSTRMTATVEPRIGIVSHIGGNVVSSVTRLAFSNASNVTFSLSTAAGAATLLASVAAAAGGGVAIGAQLGGTATSGTVVFSNTSFTNNFSTLSNIPNVAFSMDGSSLMQATAFMRVSDNLNATNTGGAFATKIVFNDSNGISWGVATTTNADGRFVEITAKPYPNLSYWCGLSGRAQANVAIDAGNSNGYVFPVNGAAPFPGHMTISTMDIMVQGATFSSTVGTASWGITLRGGLYSQVNSTQLTLLNSFSTGFSSTTIASSLSQSRNSSYGNQKWMTVHSSLWSSQPVMSPGVQYWMHVVPQIVGASAVITALGVDQLLVNFAGTVGSQNSTGFARAIPFFGRVQSSAPPVSIANTMIVSNATDSNNCAVYQFRGNIVV